MDKRLVTIALTGLITLSLTACGGRIKQTVPEPASSPTPAASATAAPTAEPTAAPTTAPSTTTSAAPTTAPSTTTSAAPTTAPSTTTSAAPTTAPTAAPTTAPTAAPTAGPNTTVAQFFANMEKAGFKQTQEEIKSQIGKLYKVEAKGWEGTDAADAKKKLESAFSHTKTFFTQPAANADEYLQKALQFANVKTVDDEYYIRSLNKKEIEVLKRSKKTKEITRVELDGKLSLYMADNTGFMLKPAAYILVPAELLPKAEAEMSRYGIYNRTTTTTKTGLRWF